MFGKDYKKLLADFGVFSPNYAEDKCGKTPDVIQTVASALSLLLAASITQLLHPWPLPTS